MNTKSKLKLWGSKTQMIKLGECKCTYTNRDY